MQQRIIYFMTATFAFCCKNLGLSRHSRLLKKLIKFQEETERKFLTYHFRPMEAMAVETQSGMVKIEKKLAIVIQGPLIVLNDFTLETIKIYRKHFPGAILIVSTWKSADQLIQPFKELGVDVLQNEYPEQAGVSNINLQIVSSRNGINKARMLGAEYVLKTRTDQRMYAPNIAEYLYNLTEIFPVRNSSRQRKRIVGVSANTFKYRMYGLSDMLLYGHIDDMALYWSADHDLRVFDDNHSREAALSLRSFARWRICEVYLASEFLAKIGRSLKWTLEDSWGVFGDHFCVIDKEQLDLFWLKYNRLEYRWLSYGEPVLHQELGFREWLNIYGNLTNMSVPEGILDVPAAARQ